eukprot:g53042.t1
MTLCAESKLPNPLRKVNYPIPTQVFLQHLHNLVISIPWSFRPNNEGRPFEQKLCCGSQGAITSPAMLMGMSTKGFHFKIPGFPIWHSLLQLSNLLLWLRWYRAAAAPLVLASRMMSRRIQSASFSSRVLPGSLGKAGRILHSYWLVKASSLKGFQRRQLIKRMHLPPNLLSLQAIEVTRERKSAFFQGN